MFNAKRKRIDNETSAVESLTVTGTATFADGSVGTPSIAFSLDPDTGLYRIGSNNIGISLGGANVLDLSSSVLRIEVPVDLDNITINGNLQSDSFTTGDITSDHILVNEQLELDQGTESLPSLTFVNDNNTGIYSTADLLAFSTGGTKRFEVSTAATTSVLPLSVSSTTESSSVSTGSIVTAGGIGAAKNIIVGGNLHYPSAAVIDVNDLPLTVSDSQNIIFIDGSIATSNRELELPDAATNVGREIYIVSNGVGTSALTVNISCDASDVYSACGQNIGNIEITSDTYFNIKCVSMGSMSGIPAWLVTSNMRRVVTTTVSGPITTTSDAVTVYRNNQLVCISWDGVSAAGNSTNTPMDYGTLPRGFWPSVGQNQLVRVTNAGTVGTGLLVINTSGDMTFYASSSGNSFTSSGSTHAVWGGSITYYADYAS